MAASGGFLALGLALFALRAADLWAEPYQVGRVWQSFDIIAELERTGGAPWKTELSSMSGGTEPAPFVQEFPLAQYGALLLRRVARCSIPESGQAAAIAIALGAALALFAHGIRLPGAPGLRLALASAVLFVPGFLRYGLTAVPDATVFLLDAAGAALIFAGRRRPSGRMIVAGAVCIGAAVLAKATALIPALVVGALLLYDRRRAAAAALALAAVPGLAWALLATRINPGAVAVNEFARLAGIRDYWWNPALYIDPWWFRNLAFLHWDTLGLMGAAGVAVAAVAALRQRRGFELGVLLLPALGMATAFNYHSASHGYYHLVWLPFTIAAAAEILASAASGIAVPLVIALGVLGSAERGYGLAERASGHPEAAQGFLSPPGPTRDAQLEAVLPKLEPGFVAYLGEAGPRFHELGRRGWIVDPPKPPNPHLPRRVIAAEEWRRVDRAWMEERMRRGLRFLVIDRASAWNDPAFLKMAVSCGFEEHGALPGHLLLKRATPSGCARLSPTRAPGSPAPE